MAEPPSKRRRPDSKQMWDASERRAPVPRDRDRDWDRRDDRDGDRERHRRYRSRSPRGRGDWDRERERDREYRGGRGGRSERGERIDGGARGMRDRPRERSRDRDRNRDDERRRSRSRSPRREREREREREQERERERDVDREGKTNRDGERKPEKTKPEFAESFSKNRAATPPVSFKVGGAPPPQEHDRMDMDGTSTGSKGRAKGGKKPREEEPAEEDEDIVVEDDGMAAMQAMMGFGGFGTTHQKKVAGNDIYAVRKEKKTEYRQYMNRVGGFNRPLSPSRD